MRYGWLQTFLSCIAMFFKLVIFFDEDMRKFMFFSYTALYTFFKLVIFFVEVMRKMTSLKNIAMQLRKVCN